MEVLESHDYIHIQYCLINNFIWSNNIFQVMVMSAYSWAIHKNEEIVVVSSVCMACLCLCLCSRICKSVCMCACTDAYHTYVLLHRACVLLLDLCPAFNLMNMNNRTTSESKLWIMVFWYMMPCSLVDGYQSFTETCCLQTLLLWWWRNNILIYQTALCHILEYDNLNIHCCKKLRSQKNKIYFCIFPFCIDWIKKNNIWTLFLQIVPEKCVFWFFIH